MKKINDDIAKVLEENGYDIGEIEVKENERGDLTITIISSRTVDKAEKDVGSKSFEEYSEALDEYLGADPDHDIRDFNSYLKGKEKITPESPKVKTAEKSGFSSEDYEAMLEKSDPEKLFFPTIPVTKPYNIASQFFRVFKQ